MESLGCNLMDASLFMRLEASKRMKDLLWVHLRSQGREGWVQLRIWPLGMVSQSLSVLYALQGVVKGHFVISCRLHFVNGT